MRLFDSYISEESKKLAMEVLESGYLNQGPMVERFEKELEDYGLKNPITISSCTAALHVALECCDVRGKEVILPSQTFIASGLAVLMAGGIPIFADTTWSGNVNTMDVEAKITKNTAAILVVHWGGKPCSLDHIHHIAHKNNLPVIEDAAHAFGAEYKGRKIGATLSDFTCFSLQAIKLLTTGDGGILCVKDKDKHFDKIQKLKWFGINKHELETSGLLGYRKNIVDSIGFKYNMNDLQAAIGIGNLHEIDDRLKKRRQIASWYEDEHIYNGRRHPRCQGSFWLYTSVFKYRDQIAYTLKRYQIPCSTVDLGIHHHPVFNYDEHLPFQNWFDSKQLSLPVDENMTREDVKLIGTIIRKINNRYENLIFPDS